MVLDRSFFMNDIFCAHIKQCIYNPRYIINRFNFYFLNVTCEQALDILLFIDAMTVDTGEFFEQSYEYITVVCWRKI